MRGTGKNNTAFEGLQEDSSEKVGFEFIFKIMWEQYWYPWRSNTTTQSYLLLSFSADHALSYILFKFIFSHCSLPLTSAPKRAVCQQVTFICIERHWDIQTSGEMFVTICQSAICWPQQWQTGLCFVHLKIPPPKKIHFCSILPSIKLEWTESTYTHTWSSSPKSLRSTGSKHGNSQKAACRWVGQAARKGLHLIDPTCKKCAP